jgi:guanylate kinase
MHNRRGRLIVLSGPSGVGKGTVLRAVLDICPNTERAITCTTREPGPGEVDGVDYCFLTEEEFRRKIDEGYFLEYAQVHLNLYGTPLESVHKILDQGKTALLEIDVQGGLTVKGKMPDAVMVFVAPPSYEELERRLRDRKRDSEESILKRLENARKEIEQIPRYEYLVLNDEIESAVDRLRAIILAEDSKVPHS